MAALHSHTLTHPRGTGSRTRALDTAEGVLIGIRRIPAADAFDELVSAARRPPPRRVRLHPRRGPGRARQRKRGTPACRRPQPGPNGAHCCGPEPREAPCGVVRSATWSPDPHLAGFGDRVGGYSMGTAVRVRSDTS